MSRDEKRSLWTRLLAVASPIFRSGMRARALGGSVLLLGLLVGVNGMNVVNSFAGREFMSALAERRAPDFYYFALVLAGVFAISTAFEVVTRYTEQLLGLGWRAWLTQHFLDRYLANRAYLRLADHHEVDNPDQRISEDVRTFTASTLSILILIVNGLLTLAAFSGVLWSISPWLFGAALLYAFCGSIGTMLLGGRLVKLDNQQLRKEADFRYALGRVREHAEAVAQMSGEEEQKERLLGKLAKVVDNFRAIVRLSRNLGFFTTGYNYFPQIIPAVVVAHLYIRGEIEFGVVTQAAMAFAQVLGAFSLIVTKFQDVTAYAAVIVRLGSLEEATDPGLPTPDQGALLPRLAVEAVPTHLDPETGAPAGPIVNASPDNRHVLYEHLTLWSPDAERPIVRDLTMEVSEGRRVAIVGPAAAAKTALLATAGLWPDGQGRIKRPGPGHVVFVPQRPYIAHGSLRRILSDHLDRPISDEQFQQVLEQVGLWETVSREGGLDRERDWAKILAPGQLQALTFARLLLIKPEFALLENPVAALDTPMRERLFEVLANSPITYISIGCQPSLMPFHDVRLELQEDGTWRIGPARAG